MKVPDRDWGWLKLAEISSRDSKDPSTKTGAVIVGMDNHLIAFGRNRFPRGVEATEDRLHDRALKYRMTVHAELDAMLKTRQSLHGSTIYIWPFMCCAPCAGVLIQAGIKRVVAPVNDNPRWQEDFDIAKTMFKEAGVQLDLLEGIEI